MTIPPTNVPALAGNDLPTNPPVLPFQYTAPQNTNNPYILFVHGWNVEVWEKDRFAETAYKRLYWQGYQGRFGVFRWPDGNRFAGLGSAISDGRNYDNSESNAWTSSTGLTNLLTKLNAEYPGKVYLMAHSMGNVVAGEALRLASGQLVNTYVAMQGAVPAHCYDPLTTTNSVRTVPDDYAQYWTSGASSYFSATAGAGAYIDFYNINDFALGWWNVDQANKPDQATTPTYHYVIPLSSHPSGFYKQFGSTDIDLNFPQSTYELFAYAVPSWSFAIGAQGNVGGAFATARQVNLPNVWPPDTHPQADNEPYSAHVWHSAEFRSDNMSRAAFWNAVINAMRLNQ